MGILSCLRRIGVDRFRRLTLAAFWILPIDHAPAVGHAPEVSLEYQVKAVYLFNFAKFVEWPSEVQTGPLTICVAGHNPFGEVLDETLRGETVNNRTLASRVIAAPAAGCHIVFVPQGAVSTPFLQAARSAPILTVGESHDFISQGGIINFILEAGKVRFQIDSKAAERADLRISSHLLRLARTTDERVAR